MRTYAATHNSCSLFIRLINIHKINIRFHIMLWYIYYEMQCRHRLVRDQDLRTRWICVKLNYTSRGRICGDAFISLYAAIIFNLLCRSNSL